MASEKQGEGPVDSKPAEDKGMPGWLLPGLGGAAALVVALAYLLGYLGDHGLGIILAAAFALLLGAICAAAVFRNTPAAGLRAAGLAYIALFLAILLYPARQALLPGAPVATSQLRQGESMDLPGPGSYRILVGASLKGTGEAAIGYVVKAGDKTLQGTLERVAVTRRVGKGATARVTEAHDMESHQVSLSGEPKLSVTSVSGASRDTTPLTVKVYPMLPPWALFGAMLLLALAGAALEGKLQADGAVAMTGAAAICFALLIGSANPASALGPVLGSALLAAGGGALAGTVLKAIGRRMFPPPEPAAKPEAGKPKGKGKDQPKV